MKKTIIIILIVLLVGIGGFILYKFLGNGSIPEYLNDDYKGLVEETITAKEAKERFSKFNGTCGFENDDRFEFAEEADENGKVDCFELASEYMAYLDNGTPVYMVASEICDNNGGCVPDDENYNTLRFSFIKNAKQIISKYDQYNGLEFAFELDNGDVYYFTPLFDEVKVNGKTYSAHLAKVDMPAKLKKFSNVSNGAITFGTEIVLELENNEKYVLEYNYENNKVSLIKYDEYIKQRAESENDGDESGSNINGFNIDYISQTSSNTINVTNGSEKGNLQSLEFISNKNYTTNTSNSYFSQYDDIEEFDGDPTVLVHDNVAEVILYQAKEDYDFELFTINLVGTPKVVVSYYMASDLAQFFMYVLNENGELYRYTIDMHKLDKVAITKLNIKDVVAITDVLVPLDDEAPLEGNEYIIIKTKDNNYYKDYTYNGNKLVKLN